MDLLQVIGTLSLGSIIGIAIKHFLDKSSAKQSRNFEVKKEALAHAAAAVLGFGNRTIHTILSKGEKGKVSPMALVEYQAHITTEISMALLFVSPPLAKKLKRLNDYAYDLHKAVDKLMTSDKVPEDVKDPAAKEVAKLSKEIDAFESELLADMKKELNDAS